MTEEKDRSADIIEAHQELVGHIERSAARIRALSAVTIVVALVLSALYTLQLLLPFTGRASVTVDLADPALQATEVVVLALTILWLYVGARNLVFSSRIRKQIRGARSNESEIAKRIQETKATPEAEA